MGRYTSHRTYFLFIARWPNFPAFYILQGGCLRTTTKFLSLNTKSCVVIRIWPQTFGQNRLRRILRIRCVNVTRKAQMVLLMVLYDQQFLPVIGNWMHCNLLSLNTVCIIYLFRCNSYFDRVTCTRSIHQQVYQSQLQHHYNATAEFSV